MGRPATDKEDRLVDAAMRRFHHHGIAASSLGAIANDAGVAPGNVYYYFRSKEELTDQVIERWCTWVGESLSKLDAVADPRERIRQFVGGAGERRQGYADSGCPLAALRNDLRDALPAIAARSGQPLAMLRDWLTVQFATLPDADEARAHADFCLAALQGSYALAHAAGDARIVSHTVDRLLSWIDTVSLGRPSPNSA